MSDTLARAIIIIRGDTKHLGRDFEEASALLKRKFSVAGLSSGLLELGTTASAAFAPLALLERGMESWKENEREAVAEATKLGDATKRLGVILETTGHAAGLSKDELKDFAEEIQSLTGVASSDIMEFEARLAQFRNVRGENFKRATQAAVDWATVFGDSLPGKAMILGRALENPTQGMHMLRRAGIVLTDQQKEMITEFMKLGKVAEAQGVILDSLEKKYKGAAEKMATPLKLLKGQLSSFQEELGAEVKKREPLKIRAKIVFTEFQVGWEKEVSKLWDSLPGPMKDFGLTRATGAASAQGLYPGVKTASMLTSMYDVWNESVASMSGVDLSKERSLAKNLDKKLAESDAKYKGFDADRGKDKTEGFFAPMELIAKIQESQLGKNDKMLRAMEINNRLTGDMLAGINRLEDGGPDGTTATE